MAKINGTKVTTNEVRMSYAQVFEPAMAPGATEAKYSISLLIPKSDTETIKAVEQGIAAAQQAGVEKFGKKFPAKPKTTFRDGDEERPDDPAYKDHMFLNCTSKSKPGIIKKAPAGSGVRFIEVTDESEFYSGCYGKAVINFFAYDAQGSKGVSAGLNNLMFTRDGEAFAGKNNAEDDFADEFEDDDEEGFLD